VGLRGQGVGLRGQGVGLRGQGVGLRGQGGVGACAQIARVDAGIRVDSGGSRSPARPSGICMASMNLYFKLACHA
jgi:hypothetical protein